MNGKIEAFISGLDRLMSLAFRAPLLIYRRLLSPLLPPACRFHPSCSAYAEEALREHGALRGAALSLKRLLRCQPFHPGGFDPVPRRGAIDGY